MQLEKIVTLANKKTMIQFLAMERSLRAVGCQLPIWVIPYDDDKFELPEGSQWWEVPEILSWLDEENAHRMMRKYQCFTIKNYQFVDTDICFIRNPYDALLYIDGFVTSCGHWHNPGETLSTKSKEIFLAKSTVWQRSVFNAGQFACSQVLYTVNELKKVASQPSFIETCLHFKWHDQPGINLLVHASGIKVSNLTLPPFKMESTWAGDYPYEYESYWVQQDTKPYLIHWAGNQIAIPRPINNIFFNYLTEEEKQEWDRESTKKLIKEANDKKSLRIRLRKIKKAWNMLFN